MYSDKACEYINTIGTVFSDAYCEINFRINKSAIDNTHLKTEKMFYLRQINNILGHSNVACNVHGPPTTTPYVSPSMGYSFRSYLGEG